MNGQKERGCLMRSFAWSSSACFLSCFAGEAFQLSITTRIAKHHVVPGTYENGSELSTHQP
jgi:hypothetical protein